MNNPPLVPDHTRNKGGIIHNFPNPKIFRLRRASETGVRDIDAVLRFVARRRREILTFYAFTMQFY